MTEIDLDLPACTPTDEEGLRVDTLATGLEAPWDVAFHPDGRAFITEKSGRIRVLTPEGTLLPEPWAEVDVLQDAEAGLLGIDISPDGDGVYIAGTFQRLGSNRVSRAVGGVWRRVLRGLDPERGHATWLRVLRYEDVAGAGVLRATIIDDIPSASVHAGGGLRFGPDGLLYLSTGEAGVPWMAQDPSTTRGKILRFETDGSIPSTNPSGGSPVYASGVRNSQGMDWYPPTGALLFIDHGPTGLEREGFRTDLDELNVASPGANFGWPIVAGATRGGPLISPIADWTRALAPAAMTIASGESIWRNDIFVAGLRGTRLDRLRVEVVEDALVVVCRESLFASRYGRFRLARTAPDGTIWLGTSNRDHRGTPRPGDDMILRVYPPTD